MLCCGGAPGGGAPGGGAAGGGATGGGAPGAPSIVAALGALDGGGGLSGAALSSRVAYISLAEVKKKKSAISPILDTASHPLIPDT